MKPLNDGELNKVKCRFGCANPVGIFHVPKGCICYDDPIQALCNQHFILAESQGDIVWVVDLRHMELQK